MQRRHFLACLLGLGLLAGTGAHGASATRPNRLVFHVNDDAQDHQDAILRNLHNHVTSVGPANLDIRVLLQGRGVTLLLLPEALPHIQGLSQGHADADFRRRIDELRAEGVQFEVSGPTLVRHHINFREDLYRVQPRDVVPNALSHLAELQQRGYTYIKP